MGLLKTALHSQHLSHGARMGEFAGYDMPLYYKEGVIAEHLWVRSHAGLFDVSHMGQVILHKTSSRLLSTSSASSSLPEHSIPHISPSPALSPAELPVDEQTPQPDNYPIPAQQLTSCTGSLAGFLERLTPSSFASLAPGAIKYTVLTNAHGGIIDDLMVTRLTEEMFYLVLNAGRKDTDIQWIQGKIDEYFHPTQSSSPHMPYTSDRHISQNMMRPLTLSPVDNRSLLALQGPLAQTALTSVLAVTLDEPGYMHFRQIDHAQFGHLYIWRAGYTGEDGFEISLSSHLAQKLWEALCGHEAVKPIGLAARDSLRLEMGYPLYGQDIDETTSPVEAALGWVIRKESGDFPGMEKIAADREAISDNRRRRVGIVFSGRGIARAGAPLFNQHGEEIGKVTSGGYSPVLETAIAMGYIAEKENIPGSSVYALLRGDRQLAGRLTTLPFVPPKTRSKNAKAKVK